jgi:4-hydroxy-tetrahydrodipicolinate synthase
MFSGSIVALVTPFADDRVDEEALAKLIEWHIEQGTGGLVPCGTTGESATFSHEEQAAMIAATVRCAAGRVPVIAGAGSNSTKEAMALARAATDAGADGILTITPYYNKPTQDGLYEHFKAVRGATDRPLVLYNVPSRTGVNLLPETALRVAELGGVAAVKEASGSLEQAHALIRGGLDVLSGDDGLTWPLLAIGAKGVISVVANFAPKLMAELCAAGLAGDCGTARDRHAAIMDLADLAFYETNPIPAKTAVAELGFCEAEFRLPLVPMTAAGKERLLAGMRQYGLL